MEKGIEKFKEFFKGFGENYVIIGGTACEIHEENYTKVPSNSIINTTIVGILISPTS